jgi:hypothetical protein
MPRDQTATMSVADDLRHECELLRALHRPGSPLVLPNAWPTQVFGPRSRRRVGGHDGPLVARASLGEGFQRVGVGGVDSRQAVDPVEVCVDAQDRVDSAVEGEGREHGVPCGEALVAVEQVQRA